MFTREELAKLICEATQKTNYYCNDTCRALCDSTGSCPYCSIIAEYILQNSNT